MKSLLLRSALSVAAAILTFGVVMYVLAVALATLTVGILMVTMSEAWTARASRHAPERELPAIPCRCCGGVMILHGAAWMCDVCDR